MSVSRKRIGIVVGALTLAVIGFLAFRPQAVRVDTARARRGPMQVTIDEEGETRVRDRYVVAAPIAGRLERIRLDEGYPVEPGSVVARMYPLPLDRRTLAEATAQLEGAEAAKRGADARVEQARAALEQARREATRARRLHAEGTVHKEALELAELQATTRQKELDTAVSATRTAGYTADAARAALIAATPGTGTDGVVELRSPVQGVVLRVFEESERVMPMGTPLLELGDLSNLEIVIDVLSAEAVRVRNGFPVLIQDWGGEETLRARVRLVEPSGFTKVSALGVEEQRVNIIADFVNKPESLGHGYRVEAGIVVWEEENVLKVPSSALFRHDGGWAVFQVERGRAHRRPVEHGHRNAFEVEILSGIEEGDVVIVHPSDLVADGVRVEG